MGQQGGCYYFQICNDLNFLEYMVFFSTFDQVYDGLWGETFLILLCTYFMAMECLFLTSSISLRIMDES